MKNDDIYGLGASVLLHLLLLLAFGLMNMAAVEPEPLGFIEVDFGPIAEGRPVQRAVEEQPEAEAEPDPEPQEEEPQQEVAPPEEAKPVELPDQPEEIVDEEQVQTPEAETISPVERNEQAEVVEPEPKPEIKPQEPKPLGSTTGGETGEATGTPGPSEDEQKTAPYDIEGLENRSLVNRVLPAYTDKVNAVIKMRITVDPSGKVINIFPVQKGTPALDRAVQKALRGWRFNALAANTQRVNQRGIVTFKFVIE